MTTGCIIQARLGSSRLPHKVLMDIRGKTALQRVIERVQRIDGLDHIIVATPDEAVATAAEKSGALTFLDEHTPESDVLRRYYRTARAFKLDVIMRVTADCPLWDPEVGQKVLDRFMSGSADYVSNTIPSTFPDGLDTEVFSIYALTIANQEANDPIDREHVTPLMKRRLKRQNIWNTEDLSLLRWTLDTVEDLAYIRNLYTCVYNVLHTEEFGMRQILEMLQYFPSMARL